MQKKAKIVTAPIKHHRRSIRLKKYDYTQAGAYFITICTHNRECLFGEIVDGKLILNEMGQTIQKCWDDIPVRFPEVELDESVVMPDHFHGIICFVGAPLAGAQKLRATALLRRAGNGCPYG